MKCHRCKEKATLRMADGEPLCPACFTKAVNDEVGPTKIIVAKPSDVPMLIDPAKPTDFVPMEELPTPAKTFWPWDDAPDFDEFCRMMGGRGAPRMGNPKVLNRLGREFDKAINAAAR